MITLVNGCVTAKFDQTSGRLLELSSGGRACGLIAPIDFTYVVDGRVIREDDSRVFRVTASAHRIESVLRTAQVEIERRFLLEPGSPLLRVSYRIRGTGRRWVLGGVAFPLVRFAQGFEDVFESPRELFDDGAEVGPGRELPCWRVFYRKGYRDGLIVATRSKLAMSRFQIQADGIHVRPHSMVCYDTMNLHPPITVVPHRRYEAEFEIGPWSQRRHARIIHAARLDQPVKTNGTSAEGMPKRNLKGHIFRGVEFAKQRAVSRTFRRDRWMVAPMPWAQGGVALFATTGVRPPAIRLNPRLTGVYRVFVGIANGAGIQIRLSNDPYYSVRLCAGMGAHVTIRRRRRSDRDPFETSPCYAMTFGRYLSGKHRAAEVEYGVARMDGRSLELKRLDSQDRPCAVDYLRFEPLSPRQAAAYQKAEVMPPHVPLEGMADIPDNAWFLDAQNPAPDLFRANIFEHARCGLSRILWRIDGQCSDYPSHVNTMRYPSAKVHGIFFPQSLAYGRLLKKVDALKLFVNTARKAGVEPWGWMRFNSYSGNVVSDFFRRHPEYHEEKENGSPVARLCLAFEEVRRHKLDILLEAAGYGLTGLNLGFLRQPPMLQYHPKLVEGYRREYGELPPRNRQTADSFRSDTLPPSGPSWRRWFAYRAQFLTQFGWELREGLRRRQLGHVKVSIWVRPNHCLFDGIDLDAWLREGLCDAVICGAIVGAQEQTHPEQYRASPAWRARVQRYVPLHRCVFWGSDERTAVAESRRLIADGYDGICLYESNHAVLDSAVIHACHRLRRLDQ